MNYLDKPETNLKIKMTIPSLKYIVALAAISSTAMSELSHGQVLTSGNVIADLENSSLSGTSSTWVNSASGASSIGNFSTIGGSNANVATIGSFAALNVNTNANNAMVSALQVPASLTGNGSMTVEAWVYTNNLYSGFDDHNYVAGYGASQGRNLSYGPADGSGSNAFLTGNFNDLGWNPGKGNPPAGAWTLVDWTYDSSSNLASVYLNGVLDNSANLGSLTTSLGNFYLGVGTGGGSNPFAGNIGALRVEDGVISQSAIATNYSLGVGGEIAAAPEPSVSALLFGGLAGLFLILRLRRTSV